MKYITVLLIILTVYSCGRVSTQAEEDKVEQAYKHEDSISATAPRIGDTLSIIRVRVLENSTISYVLIKEVYSSIYHINDTIWVNLRTHLIDDLSTNTMKAIILSK